MDLGGRRTIGGARGKESRRVVTERREPDTVGRWQNYVPCNGRREREDACGRKTQDVYSNKMLRGSGDLGRRKEGIPERDSQEAEGG